MAALSAFSLVFSLYLQFVLDLRPLAVGLMMIPFALGSAVSPVFGRRHVTRSGRTVVIWGAAVVIAGWGLGGVVAWFATGTAFLVLIGCTQLVAGLGAGLVLSPNQNLTLDAVDPRTMGAAGGVLQAVQRLGSTVGTSVGTAAYFAAAAGLTGAAAAGGAGAGHVLAIPTAVAVAFALVVLALSWRDARRARESPEKSNAVPV
ncbi:hypothetical protein BJF78_25605 [Pseudonocardia sp. CNS-139]|nr:hypothetical protein BJF78_25605 [Pseudonocardia sp. CNS-139]